MNKITQLFIFSLLILLQSCNTAKEAVEVEDQDRFDKPPVVIIPPPTNADISYTNSVVYMSRERIFETQYSIISFTARDSEGVAIEEGGLNVTFSLLNDGTSTGIFAPVNDHGNGVYDVVLSGTSFGTPNTVQVEVDGNPITQLIPHQFHVLSGEFYNEIALSSPTDQDEFQVKFVLNSSHIDLSKVDADGDDLRFFDENFEPQDYWIEKWDPSGDSIIWVKVQTAGTSKIIMSYGNPTIASGSSREEVFSYDVAKLLYYELFEAATNDDHAISSYTNLNEVTVRTPGPSVTNTISPVLPTVTPNTTFGPISAQGPISGRFLSSSSGADSIMPISFASRVLGYPKSRGADKWDLYNPNSTDADLTLYNYNSTGSLLDSFDYTVLAGSTIHINYDVGKYGLIESNQTLVGVYYHSDQADGAQLLPPGTDMIGAVAASGSLGITRNLTTGTIYYSDGSSQGFSGNKGVVIDFTSAGGTQKNALGARIISNYPVLANGQADSDGTESETFWPIEELSDDYIVPADSQYITVVCPEAVSLIVTDPGGNSTSGNCTPPIGDGPGVIGFGSNVVVTFSAGTRVSGDAQFYIYYEYEDQDETNITSWKQARSYSEVDISVSFGPEQRFEVD